MSKGRDAHAGSEIGKRVRGVKFVDRLSVLVDEAPLDGGLDQARSELDHLELEDTRGSNADQAIRGYQSFELWKPRLARRDRRDGNLAAIREEQGFPVA